MSTEENLTAITKEKLADWKEIAARGEAIKAPDAWMITAVIAEVERLQANEQAWLATNEDLRNLLQSMAERIAKQSDLLSKKAERPQ